MDDFEKKPENAEEPIAEQEAGEATESGVPESDGLDEELENIRDMFQTELDNATQTYLAGGDLQDCDDSSDDEETQDGDGESEQIPEDQLCECCGEKPRDTSEGEDYPYCKDCKELMRSYPIGVKGIIVLIVVLVLGAASLMTTFSKNVEILDKAITAQEAVSANKLYSGLYSYYDAINSADSKAMPKKLVARCIKVFAKLNDYRDAVSMADRYLDESDLKNPTYKFINNYTVKNETITAIENVIYEPLSSSDTTAEDAEGLCKSLDALKEDTEHNYDEFYIDYYKYVVNHTLKLPMEDVYEELLALDEKYGKQEWVHLYDLCNAAAELGKVDEAQKYFDRIAAENAEDATAYPYLANAYRFGETVDPDKMIELTEKGFEAQGQYAYASSELYRVQAVAYLLKGDKEKAYEAATNMYSVVTQNNYSVNNLFPCLYTYALCSSLAGKEDGYKDVTDLLKKNGYDMSQQVVSAIKGDITLKEILTDAEGDLA